MKIYQAVQKLLVGDTQTDRERQAGDLIILLFFFGKWAKRTLLASSKPITGIVSQLVQAYPKKTFAVYLHKRY
jgi:hypothetical protein